MIANKAVTHVVKQSAPTPRATFDPKRRRLSLTMGAVLLFSCTATNETVRPGTYGHWGQCPPGTYQLAKPVYLKKASRAFGSWFILLTKNGSRRLSHGRRGIGIHGGGSALKNPFLPRQPLKPTHGCIRVANRDLGRLAALVSAFHARHLPITLTVGRARWDRR